MVTVLLCVDLRAELAAIYIMNIKKLKEECKVLTEQQVFVALLTSRHPRLIPYVPSSTLQSRGCTRSSGPCRRNARNSYGPLTAKPSSCRQVSDRMH